MKIDFNKLPLNVIENFKGGYGEFRVHWNVDPLNRIMSATLMPGCSIGEHTHTDSSEVIFIIQGQATAIADGIEESLSAGDCHYCPKGSTHSLRNTGNGPLKFLAVVPNQ